MKFLPPEVHFDPGLMQNVTVIKLDNGKDIQAVAMICDAEGHVPADEFVKSITEMFKVLPKESA